MLLCSSGLQITEAIQLQMEVQRRLQDQLEVIIGPAKFFLHSCDLPYTQVQKDTGQDQVSQSIL